MAGVEGAASGPTVPLVGKKLMGKLGSMVNESAAAGVSAFARRQMEKMGWTEGKGLGKDEQGMKSHVKVKKREDLMGVGVEKMNVEEHKTQWWYNVYDNLATKIKVAADSDDEAAAANKKSKKKDKKKDKKKKKQKKSTKKRERESSDDSDEDDDVSADNKENVAKKGDKYRPPTDEELFKATGGKLFGRRAYGSCTGKLKRDALQLAGKFKASTIASSSGSGSGNSSESDSKDKSDDKDKAEESDDESDDEPKKKRSRR
ncbi:TPA: hypothetical protein N0F65_001649 [Lagenidium giganteum]|uniref:G-patch domain-containing protein n=1 Tax=Lagenidium giganteum TaxID=4803 RepID=A0AAV2Z3Y8_9STRA|nr:TPA: hypothetical protein N0F65_001649 [Lagenidium giganteum]